jgi:bifunctional DNase/RNase
MTLAGTSGPPTNDEPLPQEVSEHPAEELSDSGEVGAGHPAEEHGQPGEVGAEHPAEEAADSERWRLSVVTGVAMELPGVHPEIVLQESAAPYRVVRIPVGFAEGTAIAYAWRRIATARPLTHELMTEILSAHQVRLEGVRITGRRGQSFYAELDTTGPNGRLVIPCRPSDAIALVLRQPTPTSLLVADEVLEGRELGET